MHLNPSLKHRNDFSPWVLDFFSALRIADTWHPVVTPYTKYLTFSYLFWPSHPLTFSAIRHVPLHLFSLWSFCFPLSFSVHFFFNLVIIPSLEIKARLSLLPAVEPWQPAGWSAQSPTSSSLFYLILCNHNHHTEASFLCSASEAGTAQRFNIVGSLTPDN